MGWKSMKASLKEKEELGGSPGFWLGVWALWEKMKLKEPVSKKKHFEERKRVVYGGRCGAEGGLVLFWVRTGVSASTRRCSHSEGD